MNPSRTLADRFRTQRTERIRVDGNEILSVVELELAPGSVVEVLVDEQRRGTAQGIGLNADADLHVIETTPAAMALGGASHATELSVLFDEVDAVVLHLDDRDDEEDGGEDGDGDAPIRIRLWNTWMMDGSAQAWTGNAGMVLEEEDAPEGADRRFRLWCSDGLGNATFDDLVLVITVAAGIPE